MQNIQHKGMERRNSGEKEVVSDLNILRPDAAPPFADLPAVSSELKDESTFPLEAVSSSPPLRRSSLPW